MSTPVIVSLLMMSLLFGACGGALDSTNDPDGGDELPDGGDELPDGGDVPTTLDECMASGESPDLVCEDESTFEQWAVLTESLLYPCSGTEDFSDPVIQFRFRLDDTVDGIPQVVAIRIAPSGQVRNDDRILEFSAPSPVSFDDLGTRLDWPVSSSDGSFGAAFSFFEAEATVGTITFDEAPILSQVMEGQPVSGTYEWTGGDYLVLIDSEQTSVTDTNAAVRGCFNLQSDLYPMELDE